MEYSIKQFAELIGATSRTLRHYDQLGILNPSRVTDNGYRYYNDSSALRMQKILLLKHMGMPLEDIKQTLSHRDSSIPLLEVLLGNLYSEQRVLSQRIRTVTQTIAALKNGEQMSAHDALQGFNEQYKEEVVARWGNDTYIASQNWWENLTTNSRKRFTSDVQELNTTWINAWASGIPADSPEAQEIAAQHTVWLASIPGTPAHFGDKETVTQYIESLAHMYPADPRFSVNYGGVEGAEYVRDALLHYVRSGSN